ncbi:MAG TPA: hypothetical protein ENI46_02795 [Firmicutes bacterium]|nr:hypothetical protein [Bacillota bacterium]
MKSAGRTVLVAMSGGVDSSVAAAVLKEQGFEVVGVTMKIWDCGEEWTGCCGVAGVEDARRVAHHLGIPHYVIDLRDAFEELIIKPFCEAYLEGKTPNPCVLCNKWLKFGELLKKAVDDRILGDGRRVMFSNLINVLPISVKGFVNVIFFLSKQDGLFKGVFGSGKACDRYHENQSSYNQMHLAPPRGRS